MEVNHDFVIEMLDPCENTVLDAFPVNNMQTAVHGTADVQLLSIPTDSIASLYGDLSGETYCGTKTLTIQSVVPATPLYSGFLTFDTTSTPQLTALTNDPSHQGLYTVTLLIVMDEFPAKSITTTFTVDILSCQVSSMTKTAVAAQSYIVYTP